MPATTARVGTTLPRRYMTQLCKHFEHRLAVSYDETQGRIAFQAGVCRLAVEPDALVMTVEAAEEAALPQLQDVVARHLLRFAFREPPKIEWLPAAAAGASTGGPG
jgi:uncharacterized protein